MIITFKKCLINHTYVPVKLPSDTRRMDGVLGGDHTQLTKQKENRNSVFSDKSAKITQHFRNNYATFTQHLRNIYATITQHLRNNYATITQHLRNNYATFTQHICNVRGQSIKKPNLIFFQFIALLTT